MAIVQGQPIVQAESVSVSVTTRPAADDEELLDRLGRMGFPRGLSKELVESCKEFPVRFWIVDNSGSMNVNDGTRLMQRASGPPVAIKSSRWTELADAIVGIGELASALEARTEFVLLNRTSQGKAFALCADADATSLCADGAAAGSPAIGRVGVPVSLDELEGKVRAISPSGSTPLTEAVMDIVLTIEPAAAQLRAKGQRAAVVLATDGLPNDRKSFLAALKRLQRLPVWLVVRLCTDDDGVVQYWNELDGLLELEMEVLDDNFGEAHEVHRLNSWLRYSPHLHQARTFGLHNKLFDLLDEHPFMPSQVKQCVEAILGCGALPEPDADPSAFRAAVAESLGGVAPVFDPVSKSMKPWVDAGRLCRKRSGWLRCFV